MATVVLDAGHGGSDLGATYDDRIEKNDNLALTLAVGEILQKNGINVVYTRTGDVYETPLQKANEANAANADYFVSIHRNSTPVPNSYSGVESLVYSKYGKAYELATNINEQLSKIGMNNLGINERKNLVVLRRTNMPAVLLEIGYVNTDADNAFFDAHFDEIANAIAQGILETVK
ncbi:MAG: N-acetylmuramoyl-L-alanine amidase [Lachnospiraceae bacterium]